MYEFLDRLVNVALPRVRDFRGVSTKSFDGRGNYTLGIKDQLLFPEIPPAIHHYYHHHEWDWCVQNHSQIDQVLLQTLHPPGDENVWKFYGEESVAPGSPSRTQYYWAAHRIREWMPDFGLRSLAIAHGWHAERFECFGR
jgi:hypothetical protein